MKRSLSLLLCFTLMLGLCLFAAPAASAAAPKYASWREAYTALLTDEKARAGVIGSAADYRNRYFSSDPEALAITAYAAADINGDGTPELLLYAEGTGLTDVFTYDGALRYLGYDAYFGFLPESGEAVVHGHWHGAGGSGTNEWSVRPLFMQDNGPSAYLDYLEDGGKRRYSFLEKDGYRSGDWAEPGKNKADETRYEELYDQYVRPCVRLEDIPFFAPDNLSSFDAPIELKYMRRLYNAVGTFPYTCEEFLQQKRWKGLGLDIRDEAALSALLIDMDNDGVPELLLTNGAKKASERGSYIFRYDAMNDRMRCIGAGPDAVLTNGRALYGCRISGGAVWTRYSKALLRIRTHILSDAEVSYLEKYDAPVPLKWQSLETVADQAAKGTWQK
ncbi:MAG: hypothetical protein K6F56_08850 [Oscillospiraceae bacterium]|nr:hypothetical protein [Oscillospiraceae bacterium]